MIETLVHQVVNSPVRTVSGETTATVAAERLRDRSIGSLVVVTEGTIEGVVAESDVSVLIAERRDPELPVSAFMSAPVVTIEGTERVRTAAKRMREHGVKKLPVTEEGALAGMVTTTDLAYYLPRYRTEIVADPSAE
jgi:CBS domain-containing protein